MSAPETQPLVAVYEHPDLPHRALPAALAALYGGDLDFPERCVCANFVSSIDGVATLGPAYPSSGSAISGRSPADRFVMGLVRSCAHAVVVGAGALRRAPAHYRWSPEDAYPAASAEFAALRQSRKLPGDGPELVVVTASGDLPADHEALTAPSVIATTAAGAAQLSGRVPATCTVLSLGDGAGVRPRVLIEALRERGHSVILSEAGPRLAGQLVDDDLLDELFLTVSPVLAGRDHAARDGLIAGLELLPERRDTAELVSARHQASYLFLRYRFPTDRH
ncbi:MAG TPA: dihydrofolate reductase family protein [Actinospica sp.]|nr:dihydrofolate reductase family protein [Actinospica sp.]